jgi:hypothetical protein
MMSRTTLPGLFNKYYEINLFRSKYGFNGLYFGFVAPRRIFHSYVYAFSTLYKPYCLRYLEKYLLVGS